MADRNLAIDLTIGVTENVVHRVRRYGFGDGYEQLQPDGINSKLTEYTITTRPLTAAAAGALRTDLDNVARGDHFLATLQPFSSVQQRYRIKDNKYSEQILPSTNRRVFTFVLQLAFVP